jgi:hypothetical protein
MATERGTPPIFADSVMTATRRPILLAPGLQLLEAGRHDRTRARSPHAGGRRARTVGLE